MGRRTLIGNLEFIHNIILWWINSNSLEYATGFQNETDRLALLAFKQDVTLDPHGVFKSWNNSLHDCDWEGVLYYYAAASIKKG